ncbi:MAG: fibrobacter succinogenes major paralogous domain-containing protein [Candidatus Zixiibacteriota bacterium]|nr:MAG: fibrobacter succinogenes major paralogous domain-containing protein [candidate division Zixibacteria bacterium]
MFLFRTATRFRPPLLFVPRIIALLSLLIIHPVTAGDSKDNTTGSSTDSTVADIDGNIYHCVRIGDQVWMVENLKVTRYRDGSPIEYISDDTAWSLTNWGAYCWYEDDSLAYNGTYGAFYNFYAVVDSRGLAPAGWHIPTWGEWLALEAYLGGQDVAGGKLKATGAAHWIEPNTGATDQYGFRGLPAGGRGQITGCGDMGGYATWWSSTSYDSLFAWHYGLSYDKARVRRNPGHKASGFSVRCVKDKSTAAE